MYHVIGTSFSLIDFKFLVECLPKLKWRNMRLLLK